MDVAVPVWSLVGERRGGETGACPHSPDRLTDTAPDSGSCYHCPGNHPRGTLYSHPRVGGSTISAPVRCMVPGRAGADRRRACPSVPPAFSRALILLPVARGDSRAPLPDPQLDRKAHSASLYPAIKRK